MQLGKALLGAIIGAAVGIGILFVVYKFFEIDGFWMAIPFAFITGLGVRALVTTSGHASYTRGVLTMILALAAYIGGWLLVAQIATARGATIQPRSPAAAEAAPDKSGEATDVNPADKDAPAPPAPTKSSGARTDMHNANAIGQGPWSKWGAICLAIAAFVAYEMGRGSEVAHVAAPAEPMLGGTHPDA